MSWQPDPQDFAVVPGFPGGSRRKRRRQRPQGQRLPHRRVGQIEGASRERIFQDLEGLLRQLREEVDASSDIAAEQISLMAQTVSTFTRALEEQSDPISERAHSEYQRIREKLVQTLRGERPGTGA
ncbi:MAG: hypothetical protein H6Q33_2896 [Deltaproteobacteria bacterium]|nr:hypothetical protein [Deltaproteobacteria bacterium]